MDLKEEKALVLLSGGQDSTTCLFWAMKHFKEVYAIAFYYGQKHSIELEAAQKIAGIAGVNLKIFNCGDLLGGSALTDSTQDVSGVHEKNRNLPATFTAGRNALFLTVAASHGYTHDIQHIITGVCQTDYSGYPDCRQQFVSSMQQSLTLALDRNVIIHAPLMYLTKAETWKLAKSLSGLYEYSPAGYSELTPSNDRAFDVVKIIREMTITDYNGDMTENAWGKGKTDNPASQLRAKGYYEAVEKGWI